METGSVGSRSILIIDDDRLVLETLSKFFIRQGWNVEVCQSAHLGLERIEKQIFDCVLLDIKMPGLCGDEMLTILREREAAGLISKQNIIIITGYASDEATIKTFQLGAFQHVYKPIDLQELMVKVQTCLEAKNALKAFELSTEAGEVTFKQLRKQYDAVSVRKKADILSKQLGISLHHIKNFSGNSLNWKGNIENPIGVAQIPLGIAGPLWIEGKHAKGEFWVPMATTEGALVLTYDLGMRLLKMSGPVNTEVISKVIHITPMFPIQTDEDKRIAEFVDKEYATIKKIAEGNSRHTTLLGIKKHRVGSNFLLKFLYDTCDAHGLNMINHATFNACKYIEAHTGAFFYHRSHFSGVKHHSLLNEKEGYGRIVKAEAIISAKALATLKVTPQEMEDFGNRCVACGKAAGISEVNVHAANAIAAIFIACGQDVADLSSSTVCSSHCQSVDNGRALKVEVLIKNLLIATVGGGTALDTQKECLSILGCSGSGNSDKFAEIIAATVLAGEFPTAAAVINRTYVDIHNKYGRNKPKTESLS